MRGLGCCRGATHEDGYAALTWSKRKIILSGHLSGEPLKWTSLEASTNPLICAYKSGGLSGLGSRTVMMLKDTASALTGSSMIQSMFR